jgi:hypothetical protein
MQRRLLTVAWGSGQASGSLAIGATAWLVSGLSPSPLVNGLLPALATLPLLLPLPQGIRAGYLLQVVSLVLLLAVGSRLTGQAVVWPLLGIALLAIGLRMTQEPLQRHLHGVVAIPIGQLRASAESGRLIGNLLTAVLFPLGKAVLQFSQALVLLFPLAPAILAAQPVGKGAGAIPVDPLASGLGLDRGGLVQGVVFGSLFGLLPLWVRQQAAGSCFDFGMVLTAYGIGRIGGEAFGQQLRLPFRLPYALIAAILLATQWTRGWAAVLLFVPLGLLASLADTRLALSLDPQGSLPDNWDILERSSALGSLAGSLAMGLIAQLIGLKGSLPIQLLAFLGAGILLPLLVRRRG